MEQAELTDLNIKNGAINLKIKTEVAILLAQWAKDVVQDAPNYVEIVLVDPDNEEKYLVTVQKLSGKTPHQLRMEAENKLAELTQKSPTP